MTCNVDATRDLGSVAREIEKKVRDTRSPSTASITPNSSASTRPARQSRQRLLALSAFSLIGILLIIYLDFQSVRLTALVFLTLPFALIGGVLGSVLTGGVLSLGSLVGFVTVLGIAARNGIMLVSHYRHLEEEEGIPFGLDLVVRGSLERLAPILMTALATGLALVPLVVAGNKPGHEIEHPMAVVILGGLVTSTVLNLFLLPPLYVAFGGQPRDGRSSAASRFKTGPDRAEDKIAMKRWEVWGFEGVLSKMGRDASSLTGTAGGIRPKGFTRPADLRRMRRPCQLLIDSRPCSSWASAWG